VARASLYGVDAAVGHREASSLGAILVTLALSFAAQNTVTALRMNGARPLPEPAADRGPVIPARHTALENLHARRHERIQARRQQRRQARREARGWS
jgi:hypothetical protein